MAQSKRRAVTPDKSAGTKTVHSGKPPPKSRVKEIKTASVERLPAKAKATVKVTKPASQVAKSMQAYPENKSLGELKVSDADTPRQTEETKATRPTWDHWRERRFVRIWQAALLSLDFEPTLPNVQILEATDPNNFAEFRRRRMVICARCGVDGILRKLDHPLEATGWGNRYVDLVDFISLCQVLRWPGFDELAQKFRGEHKIGSETGTIRQVKLAFDPGLMDEDEDDVPPHRSKTEARVGALVLFVEQMLLSPPPRAVRDSLLWNRVLNASELGRVLQRLVSKTANVSDETPIRNFGWETFRDDFGAGRKAFVSAPKVPA